ncbi:indoleamine 2,3-dioxygenase 2 [Bombina bombina]|uniref:indoleamine 2,3-dioxygenase 2 n=1 Tax=Bombina bombina TaxID=8345 RepID=UPI00235B2A0F|nr:indoleamine 2,3-dioxygenase 2 [Bombina bombina]
MDSPDYSYIDPANFYVTEDYGFILKEPLTNLPVYYEPWMNIAENLPALIESKQLRDKVRKVPELDIKHLSGYRELRFARLILSHIVMGYVWQDGEQEAAKILPRSLAVPYHQLSQVLGLPMIIVHADLVLANWKRKEPLGPMTYENLSPIIYFPGGESFRGFVIVTLLVEVAAIPGLRAVAQAVSAVLHEDKQTLLRALGELEQSINKMSDSLQLMNNYVDPDVFYNTIRPFLAGWKDNPSLSEGLIYEGVMDEKPLSFSGGSAAQSSIFHVFDELLGVRHQHKSADFLLCMRQYMPPQHQRFIEWAGSPSISKYVLCSGCVDLISTFNNCVSALTQLRSLHIRIVSKYISAAGARARTEKGQIGERGQIQEERGTGGSQIMSFLKSVRDTCKEGLLEQSTEDSCIAVGRIITLSPE